MFTGFLKVVTDNGCKNLYHLICWKILHSCCLKKRESVQSPLVDVLLPKDLSTLIHPGNNDKFSFFGVVCLTDCKTTTEILACCDFFNAQNIHQ